MDARDLLNVSTSTTEEEHAHVRDGALVFCSSYHPRDLDDLFRWLDA